jgi:hypothetical protein
MVDWNTSLAMACTFVTICPKFALVIAITLGPLAWRLTKYEWFGLETKENITYEKFTYDRSSLATLIWGCALLDLIRVFSKNSTA